VKNTLSKIVIHKPTAEDFSLMWSLSSPKADT
jgi:hypothetical protein